MSHPTMKFSRHRAMLLLSWTVGVLVLQATSIHGLWSETSTCCWPDAFQTRIGSFAGMPTGGSPGVNEEMMLLEFDHQKNRWAVAVRDYFVTNEYTESIYAEDYNKKQFIVANFQGCARIPMEGLKYLAVPCVPDGSENLGVKRVGNETHHVLYDHWSWIANHTEEDVPIRINSACLQGTDKTRLPMFEIGWWTARNFNYTTYLGFLDQTSNAEGMDSLFEDLDNYYGCEDYIEMPKQIDARPWNIAEIEYLMQRLSRQTL